MTPSIPRRRFLKQATAASIGAIAFPMISRSAIGADRIRIGQVGTRHAHASGKVQAIRKLNDTYELVGVIEPDVTRREALEKTPAYRGVTWLSEEQLLNIPGLKAVAVETTVNKLVPTAMRCIKADMHVHLDKPAGSSMKACRELHAEADRRALTIQMGYMLRYNPGFDFLFKVVRDGWLGPITELNAMMGKMAGDAMRLDLQRFPGGGMFELACHVIDCMVTVLGKPQNVTAFTRRTRPDHDTFADNQLAVFEYPHTLATVRCNHLDPFGSSRRQFNVVGEQGGVAIRPLEPPNVLLSLDRPRGRFKKGKHEVALPNAGGRYDGEFEDLAKVIRGEKRLAWNSAHDLAVHETLLRACGMGEWVPATP